MIEDLYDLTYNKFIRCFDAIDNGIDQVNLI